MGRGQAARVAPGGVGAASWGLCAAGPGLLNGPSCSAAPIFQGLGAESAPCPCPLRSSCPRPRQAGRSSARGHTPPPPPPTHTRTHTHTRTTHTGPRPRPPPAGSVAWSHDGAYMATRCDSMPTAVWVWETSRLELASLLLQARPVRCAQWCPATNRLVVSTGAAGRLRYGCGQRAERLQSMAGKKLQS